MQITEYNEPTNISLDEKSIRYLSDCSRRIGIITSPKIDTVTANCKKKIDDALALGNVFLA